jgi:SAM-dependent methyltransferase
MTDDPLNDPIWSYFQNEAQSVFDGSHVRLDYLVRAVGRLVKAPRPTLLNIGIGDGHLERTAHERGWVVHALDPSPESVAALVDSGIAAQTGRIEAMPFSDGQFDCVVASEVFEHLTDAQRAHGLEEIRRVLKGGGYLVGTVPYREVLEENLAFCPKCQQVFHRWGHTTSFDLAKMRAELAPHFGQVTCRRTAFVQFTGRSLGGKIKSLLRLVLGKCGASIAVPNVLFTGRKS